MQYKIKCFTNASTKKIRKKVNKQNNRKCE